MDFRKIYWGILVLGVILLLVSFFVRSATSTLLVIAVILILFALLEQLLLHKPSFFHKGSIPAVPLQEKSPVAIPSGLMQQPLVPPQQINFQAPKISLNPAKPVLRPQEVKSHQDYVTDSLAEAFSFQPSEKQEGGFFHRLFSRKKKHKPGAVHEQLMTPKSPVALSGEEGIEHAWESVKNISQKPQNKNKEVFKEQAITPVQGDVSSRPQAEQLEILKTYIQESIQQHFPLDAVKEAALRASWPAKLIDQAIKEIEDVKNKKKMMTIAVLAVVFLFLIFIFNALGLFLFPYWIKNLKYASPKFYLGAIALLIGITIIFVLRIRKTVEKKKVEYKLQEEEHVVAIKKELEAAPSAFQTDLDRLYQILVERGKISFNEITKAFNVTKEQAEEWGKILKEQDLVTIHYPPFGEPELLWKKQ